VQQRRQHQAAGERGRWRFGTGPAGTCRGAKRGHEKTVAVRTGLANPGSCLVPRPIGRAHCAHRGRLLFSRTKQAIA
jgi:hypothetical protein